MNRKAILAASGALIVVACATTKTMNAITGSRADGTVQLGFEYGMFESPRVDMASALQSARKRCGAWGYSDAEPFGAAMTQCVATSGYGCVRSRVTVEYQCTNSASNIAPSGQQPAMTSVSETVPGRALVEANASPGTIDLGGGVKLIPAKTLSGYCIKGPPGYVGTGSVNRPSITTARPICM
jgi:hypothetical protein